MKNTFQQNTDNKESHIRLTGLQAKNEELNGHYNNLKIQLKSQKQDIQQLNHDLREAKEKCNNLSRENRMLQLGFQNAEEYLK